MGKFKNQKSKIKIIFLLFTFYFLLFTLALLYPNPYTLTPTHAQACPTQGLYPRVQQGLISAPAVTQNFGSDTGECVVDSKAAFAPYKLPSYADLKSLYYTQSKATKSPSPNTNVAPIVSTDDGKVFHYTATPEVNINGTYNYNATAVIFIEGKLNIKKDIQAQNPASQGLVFVVQGDVNIDKDVKQIDAVIISQGTIRTAGSTCTQNSIEVDTSTDALTVNGSLISLDVGRPIQFCRKLKGLGNDQDPAEIINNQVKYLVILKDLFADTIQRWSEIQ